MARNSDAFKLGRPVGVIDAGCVYGTVAGSSEHQDGTWAIHRLPTPQTTREFNAHMEGRVDERARIARELHDTLLQSFQGLMLCLQTVRNLLPARPREAAVVLDRALRQADQAIIEGRETIQDLRSSTIVTSDLAQALRAFGDDFTSEDSAEFRIVVEGQPQNLHPIVHEELYRIACEALRNAFVHGRARHIEAEITYGYRSFRMRIRDDGQGIAPEVLQKGRSGHFGLAGIRERARQIGSKLSIWGGAGVGTEIDLTIDGSIAYGAQPERARFWLFRTLALLTFE